MKRYQDHNYYELLEIPPDAALSQIQASYFLAKKTYGGKSLGTHSLFSEEERETIWKKIEEAYCVLSDFDKRRRYDYFLAKGADLPESFEPSGGPVARQEPIAYPDRISGSFLKTLREQKGVTLQNIISQTRIAENYLAAIENDQFKNFPPEVYLKSYLNEYAKYLHLDARKLTEGYLRYFHQSLQNPKK